MTIEAEQLWRDADVVLDRLLDMPAAQRAGALAAMQLGNDVRAIVERLLTAHDARSGVLDRALAVDAETPVDSALSGRQLGRWRLESEIGRGGMAVVYRARATDGSALVAAVKVMTIGAWAARGVEQFRQEQALLARLRHVHIATLFESGVADDGTPWLAMAMIEGVRIDTWCERRALSPRAIVALFLGVCDAVAYAHRNLVIHRDLKPSNVLVDDDGHVRLVDFGIARLADAQHDITATQWRALTPDYAAPEQFAGAPPSTAMDVYGLGALLYRLLSGRSPKATVDADDMPTAPSRTMRDPRAATSVKGDLDAIVLKALAHDPAQRYDSATTLAQDLVAWLDHRPVAARTHGIGYRLAKFVARHRVGVAATAAIVLAVIVGVAATLWQAQRARDAAMTARAEAAHALEQAQRATAIKQFVLSLFEALDPERPGGAAVDSRDMLKRGVERIRARDDLAGDVRVEILTTIADAQRTMAWYDDASAALDHAASLVTRDPDMPALARAMIPYERALIERAQNINDHAIELFAQAESIAAADTSVDADVFRVRVQSQVAGTLAEFGKWQESADTYARAQRLLDGMPSAPPELRMLVAAGAGATAYSAGDYATSLAKLRVAYDLQRRSGNEGNASMALTLNHLSAASSMMGLLGDAVRYDSEALAIARKSYPADHPQVATAVYAYGDTLRQAGRFAESLAALDEARDIRSRIGPPNEFAMVDLTRVRVMVAQGRYADAVSLAETVRPEIEKHYGATSMATLQLLIQEIASLTIADPKLQLPRVMKIAEQRLSELDDETRWHPVAQYVRWRIANAHYAKLDLATAEQWLERTRRPDGKPNHSTTELVLMALRQRVTTERAFDAAQLRTSNDALANALKTAQGASTEALAYGWLTVADAASRLGNAAGEAAALDAIDAVNKERTLPAEYAEALRAARARLQH